MSEEIRTEVAPEPSPKKERIFYPICFALFPLLSIYSANLSLVPWRMMIRPVCVVTLATLAIWGLLSLVLRSVKRGAIATSAFVVCSLMYSRFYTFATAQDLPHGYIFGTWIGLTIILMVVFTLFWRWHKILNVLGVCLVLAASVQIVTGLQKAASHVAGRVATTSSEGGTTKDRPDIIYIILDGYGRSDALKRALGYSNDTFIQGLEQRGFYVAADAHANYCQTELSVSSSLNMDFIQNLLPKMTAKDGDRSPLDDLLNHNAVADYLRKRGYVFAAITTGFPPLQFPSADVNMKTRAGFSLIESAFIQMTPLANDGYALQRMFEERRSNIINAFDQLESLSAKSVTPRFVMVHILAPHPPFVIGPNGEQLPPQSPFGFWDGSDYLDHVGSAEQYRNGYTNQAEYLGKRVLKAIDALFAERGTKPVILIQGDHGSKMRLDQATLEHTDVNECFPNLSAYYVPDSVKKNLYPGITPVNSFRTVFNGLFGDHLPTLPDQSWYSSFPFPYQFIEVTSQIANHEKMASVPIPHFPPRPKPVS